MKRLIVFCSMLVCLSIACGDENNNNTDPPPKENNQNNDQNTPPTAEAGDNQIVKVGEEVTLNAASSSDADGDLITIEWTLQTPDGSTVTLTKQGEFKAVFVPDVEGDFVATLKVSDGKAETIDRVTIRAQGMVAPNEKPVAVVTDDKTIPLGGIIALDGSGSSDPDGDMLTYRWTVDSAPAGSAAAIEGGTLQKTNFTPDIKGDYVIQLVVNDGTQDSAPATMKVTVLPETMENIAPVADAGMDQMGGVADTITLDGSGSMDGDGDAITYTWSLTTAPNGSAATLSDVAAIKPTFKPDVKGIYTFSLVVNDMQVDSAPDTVTVTITGVNTTAPVADPGPNFTTAINQVATLDGTRSTDVDNDPLTYQWLLLSKPVGSTTFMMNANTSMPTITPDLEGDYVVELIVNDGMFDSTPKQITIRAVDGPTTCLIISEYIEGSAENKALELYNCGASMMDMTQVGLCLVRNDSTTCTSTEMLAGLLNPQQVFGVCHTNADSNKTNGNCNISTTASMSFNGDDRLILFQDIDGDKTFSGQDFILDAFGEINNKPSSNEWKDVTFRRCNHARNDGMSAFITSAFFNIANEDDFSDFGIAPTMGCAPQNQAPTAIITGSNMGNVAQVLSFGATQSTDPENDALTYTWNLTIVPAMSNAVLSTTTGDMTSFTPDTEGDYTLTLIANDGTQDSITEEIVVNVAAAPMPSACLLISEYIEGNNSDKAVEIYNCGQSDVNLDKFGVCLVANGETTCNSGVMLTTTLGKGNVMGVCHSGIDVNVANYDKCIVLDFASMNFNGNDRVVLFEDMDGSDTYTSGDIIVDALGEIANEPMTNIWEDATYRRCNYSRYIGINSFLVTDYYTKAVGVGDFSDFGTAPSGSCNNMNQSPLANAGPDRTEPTSGVTISLDGTSSSDPDNDPLTYQWVIAQKPAMSMTMLTDPTSATPMFVPDVDGIYVFELVVDDGTTMSVPDQIAITVGTPMLPDKCLIISEYMESGNDKAIELFNCGTQQLDLTNYGVCLYSNTSTTCSKTDLLAGMLPVSSVHGLCGGSLNQSLVDPTDCQQALPSIGFNGDDRLLIFRDVDGSGSFNAGDDIMDSFGQGSMPPSSKLWEDATYRRCNRTPFDGMNAFNVLTYYTKHMQGDFSDFGDAPTAQTCP